MDWGEADAPCAWTDNRDLAVQSGFPDRDAMVEVAQHFGFATDDGVKDGYAIEAIDWGMPEASGNDGGAA